MSNPYAPPATTGLEEADGPVGIGGWLIFPVAGLFLVPVRFSLLFPVHYLPRIRDGGWMSWDWTSVLALALEGGFVLFSVVLIWLLLTGSPQFPRLFIAFTAASCVYVAGYGALAWQLRLGTGHLEHLASEILRTVFLCAIWVPYMRRSKRVRNTFRARPSISE